MKCSECSLWWYDEAEEMEICHVDPNWSAPCEEEEIEDKYTLDDLGNNWY